MPGRRAIVTIGGEDKYLPSTDFLLGAGDLFHGTTQYQAGQARMYVVTGSTDSNGRVTIYPTSSGLVGGVALFSSIIWVGGTSSLGSTTPGLNPYFELESISADKKTVVLRGITFPVAFLSLGVNYSPASFAGTGVPCMVKMIGLPA